MRISLFNIDDASFLAASDRTMRPVQNMFEALSKPAEAINVLAWITIAVSILIFVVVSGLLVWILIRYHRTPYGRGKEPPQIYGSTQIELAWTVIPIIIVFGLMLVTARTVAEIQNAKMPEDAIKVRLVGRQWWWEVHYPDLGFETANEIHVPLSTADKRRVTHFVLESADVVHSFWVPQLAGKTDVLPNHPNETWIEPTAEGVYFGNCAEYCGTQHANMLLRVIVEPEEEFQKWVANEKAPPVDDPAVAEGKQLFSDTSCINCHTIGGSVAKGNFGPDLTHLMSRQTIGAGVAPLNYENLLRWMRDPQEMKIGCLMPNMLLTDEQVTQITDYLYTLK
jgi:cytochrome c oxidase subunit 2